MGTLCVSPTLYDFIVRRRKDFQMPILRAGIELGFWTLLSNVLQIAGMKYITASRGAFLTQLCTVIVPFVAFFSGFEPSIPARVWAACFMSLCGVGLLSLDGAASAFSFRGDLLLVCSAFSSAAYVLRSKIHSGIGNTKVLAATKVLGQFSFCLIYLVAINIRTILSSPWRALVTRSFVGATPWLVTLQVLLILYLGILHCYGSTLIQITGQKKVSASEAAVIFSTTPLWATALAIPLGERFGLRGVLGALFITLATLMTTTKPSPDQTLAESALPNKSAD